MPIEFGKIIWTQWSRYINFLKNDCGKNYENYAKKNSLKDPKLIKIDQILLYTPNITPFLGGGPSWAVILIETKKVHILPIFSHGNVGHPPIGPWKIFYYIKLAILVKFGCYPVIFRPENIIFISMLRLKNLNFPISWVLGSRFRPYFKMNYIDPIPGVNWGHS